MVTISNTGTIPADPNVRCYTNGEEADTSASTGNWQVSPGETKDVPVSWRHYSDEAVTLSCTFLYPDVLEPVSNLIAEDIAAPVSNEVSWTTAEEVEELPILLYGVIIAIVVGLGAFVALSSRQLQTKEYIVSEEEHYEESDNVDEDSTDSSEESDEEEIEENTWTDADGNPIVSVKEE